MRPLFLGHRGARASRHIPENTTASFELCLQHGCDGFEFDVRRSADGEAVICHDPKHKRVEIAKTPSHALGLPTLEQVLQQFSARAFLDIELKVAGLEEPTIASLRRHPPAKGYLVSSFLPDVLSALHEVDASVPLGFLCERSDIPLESTSAWIIPRVDLVDQALITKLHAAGKKVMVWTVNRVEQMRELLSWGADAIISDETELAAQIVHRG